MPVIKVLVVDDSLLIRQLVAAVLETDDAIHVVGEAGNGRDGVEKAAKLKPDIVIMDIEMPVMNGLEAIERIMASNAVPILVLSSESDSGTAYAAMSKGALEVVSKAGLDPGNPDEFVSRIKLLVKTRVISHIRGESTRRTAIKPTQPAPSEAKAAPSNMKPTAPDAPFTGAASVVKPAVQGQSGVVAIASSTGGPRALSMILPDLPEDFPYPIVIAQHISDGFVGGMVEWLAKSSRLRVKVAEEGDLLLGGSVYISPSEKHMKIGDDRRIRLLPRKCADIYHPSCNMLLSSAADVFGRGAIGIILTGMGNDGLDGIRKIKAAGGLTIAQDEESSAVFGMPKAAIESGCIDRILPLSRIGMEVIELAWGKP